MKTRLLVAMLLAAFAIPAQAGQRCTTCARGAHGHIQRNRSADQEFKRETGYPHGRPGYVVDHVVPLKKGGCDCAANMQWQTKAEARAKDRWE